MRAIWAEQALTEQGWTSDVRVLVADDGRIDGVSPQAAAQAGDHRVAALLPAPVNLHSHAFQRAMAGMTERRGPNGRDTFWTWRQLMFRFLEALTPEDIEAIAAFVQMEMLEAGYAAVAEFHYVHHQADGRPYADVGELSSRIASAAETSGIGLTLLPVLYQYAGVDRSPLAAGQVRFGNDLDRFVGLYGRASEIVTQVGTDAGIGVAPHSLRAVGREGLAAAVTLAPDRPLHMHLAEQIAEVDEIAAAYGQRPVEWLLDHHEVDNRWCLIHCTQVTADEILRLAHSEAVTGLCPITESSLGDGIFKGVEYLEAGGRFGIGSDSNIRISLSEELRTLEYSQRLRERQRAVLASEAQSTGRRLYSGMLTGGGQAAGRQSGTIAPGQWADLLAFDGEHVDLEGREGDAMLDTFIFAGDDRMIADVWSAGRHQVRSGRHVRRDAIAMRYRRTMNGLKDRI